MDGAAPRVLDALARALAGRPVTVIGAAPLAPGDVPLDASAHVAVNGGIASTAAADVWIVNSRIRPASHWPPERRRLNDLMLRQGAGRRVPLAILLAKQPNAPPTTIKFFAEQGTAVAAWLAMTSPDRRALEMQAGARDNGTGSATISAGVTAAALALLAGAAPVRLIGFSWEAGYAYLPGERFDPAYRGHVAEDRRALGLLAARYGHALEHALALT